MDTKRPMADKDANNCAIIIGNGAPNYSSGIPVSDRCTSTSTPVSKKS